MLAPGFIGDVIGYLLLIPPTRAPGPGRRCMKRFEDGTARPLLHHRPAPGRRPLRRHLPAPGDVFDTTGHEPTATEPEPPQPSSSP